MTTTTATTTAWTMHVPDTIYYKEGGGTTMLAAMLKDVPLDLCPTDQEMLEDLLFAHAAWEDGDEMLAALAMRHSDDYMRNAEHEPGLKRI
ncbi:MAG: hypothetical protein IKG22_01765 [Atopobiaceae bacterium]|nr:hypothetical protein [Atopobiaceae bacterium]